MKNPLLNINHALLMLGTTIYVGVLWALHFFWYPSWENMTLDVVQAHFIGPTSEATKFFTIVVPIMFVCNLVLIWAEWRTRFRWVAIVAILGIIGSTLVGQLLIIPINQAIAKGVATQAELTPMLQEWMKLNDVRWVMMNVMWLALMYFFLSKRAQA
jgi:glucan phosphoethanolaminetransferase (alkaline phosphatase superfamily)